MILQDKDNFGKEGRKEGMLVNALELEMEGEMEGERKEKYTIYSTYMYRSIGGSN